MKRRVGRWVQAQARARDVLLLRYSESNYLEPHIARILEAFDVEVAVDVGANTGQTVTELRALGFDGQIISFEPTPDLFAGLEAKFADDLGWTGHQVALGREPGELNLNRYREESLNSFLSPTAFGRARFRTMAEAPIGTVTVPVATLDDVWAEMIPSGRTFLKIDTQGFDVEVLEGARRSLDDVVAILTEVPINPIYEGMPTMSQVFALMEELGFQLSGLFPVSKDRRRVRMIEGNCMFIRGDRLEP